MQNLNYLLYSKLFFCFLLRSGYTIKFKGSIYTQLVRKEQLVMSFEIYSALKVNKYEVKNFPLCKYYKKYKQHYFFFYFHYYLFYFKIGINLQQFLSIN